jgi:hypothetical protein
MTHVKQSSSNKATSSAFSETVLLTQFRCLARISTGDVPSFLSFDLPKFSFL